LLAAAIALATLAVGVISRSPTAQTDPEVYEACRPDRDTIPAPDLPETVELESCPIGERVITDHGAGTVLPDPGEGVYTEVLTTTGAQELEVTHYRDGTVEFEHVGNDSNDEAAIDPASSRELAARGSPGECADPAFNRLGYRVGDEGLRYSYNRSTTPRNLRPAETIKAIRRGGANVATTRNTCRLGDRVPVGFAYAGKTSRHASFDSGACRTSDGVSVVSFGSLQRALAVTCTYWSSGFVNSSDVKIDKSGTRWTTNPNSRNCRNAFDLEGVMTHERGHTFGLGHVAENYHRNLTMSPIINGTCQSSERTLGRGDVLGLEDIYKP
jgi:hypothetical protein